MSDVWTLEIDDESLANWGPISSTYLFNSESPPTDWQAGDYRVGILIQPGVRDLIDLHRGDHSAIELRHLLLRKGDETELRVTRSHFMDLGLWVNILPGGDEGDAPKIRSLLGCSASSYAALFGRDGRNSVRARRFFKPYGGGITIWPEKVEVEGGNEQLFKVTTYANANTPHHVWHRISFCMKEKPEVYFNTRSGVLLPESFANPIALAPREVLSSRRELPSLRMETYGIPPGGDGGESNPLPEP